MHDDFIPYQQSLLAERARRASLANGMLTLGIPYLDDALGGLPASSLLLIGARTGVGKTQLVAEIAHANAAAGKRVHFFALEAEFGEIQARMKYQLLANYWYHKKLNLDHPDIHLNYMSWSSGQYGDRFEKWEDEIESFLGNAYSNLSTYYRQKTDFTVAHFRKMFQSIQDKTDLVIVDHLHYFDFDDDNENKALREAMKAIRDCALVANKPVILVAHLRKRDRSSKQIMPDIDDFHGSSELTKIATDVVLLSPAKADMKKGERWATLMRVGKCRRDGSRTRYLSVSNFSTSQMRYDDKYYLSKVFEGQEDLELLQYQADLPYWAKNALPAGREPGGNIARKRKDLDD